MMQSENQAGPVSKAMLWTGRIMSAIPVLITLMSSMMKLVRAPAVVEGVARTGFSPGLIVPIGILELVCVVVYLIPRTAVLGAILLTGLLGGATVTTLRIGDPTFPLPVVLGMMAWGGLYLRDRRVRALIPLRRDDKA
jgi:DoxX-like protein